MAEKSFPLENTAYTAEDAQLWFATRTSGVYTNGHLAVTADGTMNVTLGAGVAWLHYNDYAGCVYANTAGKALTVTLADAQYKRIDRVCIRLEMLNNKCYAYIKKGTAAASPSAPALQRDSVAYEISLAQITVAAGVTAINAGNITDERLNDNVVDLRLDGAVCGLMRDGVTGIDTSVMQNQFSSALNSALGDIDSALSDAQTQVSATLTSAQTQTAALIAELEANIQTVYDTVEKVNLLEFTGTLSASGWSSSSPFTQDVTATGLLGSDTPFVDINMAAVTDLADMQALSDVWVSLFKATAGANKVTVVFGSKPEIDIPIKIKVVR